jgi:hypothetical protein
MDGHVASMEEMINAYKILVGKPEGKIPLGRPRIIREDNIKNYLTEIEFESVGLDSSCSGYHHRHNIPPKISK